MTLDFLIINARFADRPWLNSIAVAGDRIAAIAPRIARPGPVIDAEGAMAFGGFVDCHIHLDKALLLDRCSIYHGTLSEAISLTTRAKTEFTIDDVTARALEVAQSVVMQGTTRMRSFVELDPGVGTTSLTAPLAVKGATANALEIDLCAFAQEGTTQTPETLTLLDHALNAGATPAGGCTYTDRYPARHVAAIFELVVAHDVAVDFHADFDLDPNGNALPLICFHARRHGWEGRVSIGHATKLSAMRLQAVVEVAAMLADAGVAITALPATDLFLLGRDVDHLTLRGACASRTPAPKRGVHRRSQQQHPQSLHPIWRRLDMPHRQPIRQCRPIGARR